MTINKTEYRLQYCLLNIPCLYIIIIVYYFAFISHSVIPCCYEYCIFLNISNITTNILKKLNIELLKSCANVFQFLLYHNNMCILPDTIIEILIKKLITGDCNRYCVNLHFLLFMFFPVCHVMST